MGIKRGKGKGETRYTHANTSCNIGGNRLVAMAGSLFGFQGVTKRLNRD